MKTFVVACVILSLFASQQTEAKDCPKMCTLQYAPVCGTDGVTYGNECMLRGASCRSNSQIAIAYTGPCCPLVCTADYSPVCGSDGVTYGNACMLRGASCKNDNKIHMVHRGEC